MFVFVIYLLLCACLEEVQLRVKLTARVSLPSGLAAQISSILKLGNLLLPHPILAAP